MTTHCRIGYEFPDGTVRSIYCHFDGYPEGVGYTLTAYYNSESKILELLGLGDISVLAERVAPFEDEDHSFLFPRPDVTIAYDRDRGESDVDAMGHKTIEHFFEEAETYMYLFTHADKAWHAYEGRTREKIW